MNRPLSPQERLALEKLVENRSTPVSTPIADRGESSPALREDEVAVRSASAAAIVETRTPEEEKDSFHTHEQIILAIQQRLARLISEELAGHLALPVVVNAIEAKTISLLALLNTEPTAASLFRLEDPSIEGSLYFEAPARTAQLFLGQLLDLSRESDEIDSIEDRPLSPVEEALLVGVFDRITRCLREAWQPIATVDFQLVETHKNGGASNTAEDHLMTRIEFQVQVDGEGTGFFLAIPDSTIVSLIPGSTSESSTPEEDPCRPSATASNLGILSATTVEVAAVLTTVPVSLLDLLELKPGDVIQTDRHNDDLLLLEVEGTPAFTGRAKKRGERYLFEIEGSPNGDPDESGTDPASPRGEAGQP